MQIQFLTNCNRTLIAQRDVGVWMKGWNTNSLATRLIQIRSFTRVFFALMLLDRKPSSSVTFSSRTSINFSGDRAFISNAFQRHQHACSHNRGSNSNSPVVWRVRPEQLMVGFPVLSGALKTSPRAVKIWLLGAGCESTFIVEGANMVSSSSCVHQSLGTWPCHRPARHWRKKSLRVSTSRRATTTVACNSLRM